MRDTKEGYLSESDLQVMSFAKNSKTMMMLDKERYLELLENSLKCEKLNQIHKEINNVKYFGLCQSTERILWNLVYDIARILEVDEDELGKEFIE